MAVNDKRLPPLFSKCAFLIPTLHSDPTTHEEQVNLWRAEAREKAGPETQPSARVFGDLPNEIRYCHSLLGLGTSIHSPQCPYSLAATPFPLGPREINGEYLVEGYKLVGMTLVIRQKIKQAHNGSGSEQTKRDSSNTPGVINRISGLTAE